MDVCVTHAQGSTDASWSKQDSVLQETSAVCVCSQPLPTGTEPRSERLQFILPQLPDSDPDQVAPDSALYINSLYIQLGSAHFLSTKLVEFAAEWVFVPFHHL